MENKILVIDRLNENALLRLMNDAICVLKIPQFCDSMLCDQLAHWFATNEKITQYHYVMKRPDHVKAIYYGVDRVGVPYNSTYGDMHIKEQYYQEALPGIRAFRAACHPYLSPIDRLRVELDDNWLDGANLANFEGKKMFVGIGRIMQPEFSHLSELQPHWDSVPTQYAKLLKQFSANIYVSVPRKGGELEIWDVPPIPTSVIHEHDPDRNWRAELPESLKIKPEKGDLLLFNTRRPHAIGRFHQGSRITAQCFIGINTNKSLSLWT